MRVSINELVNLILEPGEKLEINKIEDDLITYRVIYPDGNFDSIQFDGKTFLLNEAPIASVAEHSDIDD